MTKFYLEFADKQESVFLNVIASTSHSQLDLARQLSRFRPTQANSNRSHSLSHAQLFIFPPKNEAEDEFSLTSRSGDTFLFHWDFRDNLIVGDFDIYFGLNSSVYLFNDVQSSVNLFEVYRINPSQALIIRPYAKWTMGKHFEMSETGSKERLERRKGKHLVQAEIYLFLM